jgi:hypothetical protein
MVFQLSSAPTAPAPPPETDASLFERLRAGIEHGQVTLDLDFKRLRQGDSPVSVSAYANLWFLGSVVAIVVSSLTTGMILAPPDAHHTAVAGANRSALMGQLFALLAGGWISGAIVLVLAVIAHIKFARPLVNQRIEKRVLTDALKDVAEWRKLWRFGGVALRRGNNTVIPACRAPDGNWFDFTRRLPPTPQSRT